MALPGLHSINFPCRTRASGFTPILSVRCKDGDAYANGGGVSVLRIGLVVVLALIILAVAFLSFSKPLMGEDYLKEFVLEQLEESLGRKIDVGHVKLVIFPRIRVELSQVAVHDPGSEQVMLTAKRVDMVVRLLPLLRKQIVGKRLLIEEPTLIVRRNEDGHWNLGEGLSEQTEADQRAIDAMARIFMIRQAALVNGTITVIDASRPDGVRSLTLEHVEAKLLIQHDRGVADLHIGGSPSGAHGLSAVSLDGVIRRSEMPVSLTGEALVEPGLLFQFDGHLEAVAVDIRAIADWAGSRPVPEKLQGAVNLQGAVQIMPGVAGYDLVMSDMVANLNDMELAGNANLAGLLTQQPTFAVTFTSSLVSLSQLLKTVPAEWIDPRIPALLADRRIDGKVQVVTATVTGGTGAAQLSATGEFHVQDMRGLIGQDRVAAHHLAATVSVEPGRIRVADVTGNYGAIQVTDGKGAVSFLEAGPWLELEVTGNMAAAQLLDVLAKTVEGEQLTRVLAGVSEVEGLTRPTFRLVGALHQPGGIRFAGGEIAVHSVSFKHTALPERVTALQGRLVLGAGETQFDQVTGHLGDAVIEVHGTMAEGRIRVFQDFSVRMQGAAEQIMRMAADTVPAGAFEGRAVATLALSGQTAAPHLRGAVVLDDAKVLFPGLGEKPVGAGATVEFEGDVIKSNAVVVNRLALMLPSVQVPIKGRVLLGEQFSIDVSVATGTLSLSQLPEWIVKGGVEAGNVEVTLDVKGRGMDWHAWRMTGWVALTNGLIPMGGEDGAIQDIYARIKLVRNGAEIKRLAFAVRDSDVAIEASVSNWGTTPLITGKIESNQLDLTLLFPKGDHSPIREFLETLAATGQVTMAATIAHGQYHGLNLGALSARVHIHDGMLDVDRISGESEQGQITGRLVVQLPQKAPAEMELSFRATGLPIDELLRLANAQAHGMTGSMRVSGSIRGHGRNPHGVYPSLNGKVDVFMENGHILKSDERVLWKIIRLLNVPAVLQGKVDLEKEGLPYNKISGTVMVKDGVFQTDNTIIDSPILKITAVGHYDLPTDQLDLVTAVSPFGSYSQFLKAIPLFGRILGGERKGLATAIFAVKGAVKDPKVTYLPVKSFASGLSGLAQLAVDVLTNTLALPLDLVAPDEEGLHQVPENRLSEFAPAAS